MVNPLLRWKDAQAKLAVIRFRDSPGDLVPSSELRAWLPGFKAEYGIHKPTGSKYALWVRQTLRRKYPDKEPQFAPDGSWTYDYAPETRRGVPTEEIHSNKGLIACMNDRVPVCVVRQVPGAKKSTYKLLGLAFVESFDGSHFRLRGENNRLEMPGPLKSLPKFEPFEPAKRMTTQARRWRDAHFSFSVNEVYRSKCATCELSYRVRGKAVGLDAAHVIPVEDGGIAGDVRNGILLCKNHHALMDSYGWTLDEDYRVVVAEDRAFRESALANHILSVEGKVVPNLPAEEALRPDLAAVRYRLEKFETAWA